MNEVTYGFGEVVSDTVNLHQTRLWFIQMSRHGVDGVQMRGQWTGHQQHVDGQLAGQHFAQVRATVAILEKKWKKNEFGVCDVTSC